jgi:hypothetical protein
MVAEGTVATPRSPGRNPGSDGKVCGRADAANVVDRTGDLRRGGDDTCDEQVAFSFLDSVSREICYLPDTK